MAYVDGVILPVARDKREEYRAVAVEMAKMFKEFGAVKVVECWGDDVPEGKLTSMPMAVQCKPDETVVFSWIWWPSKAVRDEGMQKFRTDERVTSGQGHSMPIDGKRMIIGGFEVIVEE